MVLDGCSFARSVTLKWAVREIWSEIEQQIYSFFKYTSFYIDLLVGLDLIAFLWKSAKSEGDYIFFTRFPQIVNLYSSKADRHQRLFFNSFNE